MRNYVELVSLYGIQILNGLYPLFVFPFLLLQYGSDDYSEFVKAEVFSIFVLVFVLWGFEVGSVKRLRNIRYERILGRSLIFFNTLYARLIFWILSLFVVCFFCSFLFDENFVVMVVGWLLYPLAVSVFSAYYFLVYKLSFEVFTAMLLGRAVSLVALFAFGGVVDLIYIPYVISVPLLLSAFCFMALMIYSNKVQYVPFGFSRVMKGVSSSYSSFKDSLSVLFIKEFNIPIIALASSSSEMVSLYSMLDKLLRAAGALMRPISQFFMPAVMRLMFTGDWIFSLKFKRVSLLGFLLVVLGSVICVFFPFELIVGEELVAEYSFDMIMSILVFTLFFGFLNYFFLMYSSIIGGYFFAIAVLISGVLGGFALYCLVLSFELKGMVIGLLIPELLLCIICFVHIVLKGLLMSGDKLVR